VLATEGGGGKYMKIRRSEERRPVRKRWCKRCEERKIIKGVCNGGK
jgi:hypothetical protein